jgi:hypothetical protein
MATINKFEVAYAPAPGEPKDTNLTVKGEECSDGSVLVTLRLWDEESNPIPLQWIQWHAADDSEE